MTQQRDLLLVPFPFSDQSGRKVRPVIVVSNADYNDHSEDVIVIGVTSNILREKYTIPLVNNDLEEGKLSTPCCIKVENILRLEKGLIIKKIGRIKKEKLEMVFNILDSILK
ncbi:MAG: type II toxin-antitoxin system PemK/MazF family toxin [Nanoarchaeota archaeon]